ncbi:MAG TPA: nuclear transport factor 2 family protein [Pyrinomonadaceae bacterium]|nr:nuclear transport factor 2 family protein [Pyrinomonadaceae bacterium]
MTRTLLITVFMMSLAFVSIDSFAQRESKRTQNRRELVQMEYDFARAAVTKGTRDAFLEFLADDGIIFQPGPVNGKKFWTERQPRKGLLSWEPVFADVSRAGDLGYTTGPWEFRPNGPDDKPVAFGQYFTIWKKQGDGSWKAVLDRGVSSDKPFAPQALRFTPNDESLSNSKVDVAKGRAALIEQERKFSQTSAVNARTAFNMYLADDARVLRQNAAPAIGKSAASALMPENGRALTWQPTAADMSASGDLGYTYGSFELNTRGVTLQRGSYVRVWKKQGGKWKVAVDVMSPDPV